MTTDKHPQEGLGDKRQALARWRSRQQVLTGEMERRGDRLGQGRVGQGREGQSCTSIGEGDSSCHSWGLAGSISRFIPSAAEPVSLSKSGARDREAKSGH